MGIGSCGQGGGFFFSLVTKGVFVFVFVFVFFVTFTRENFFIKSSQRFPPEKLRDNINTLLTIGCTSLIHIRDVSIC